MRWIRQCIQLYRLSFVSHIVRAWRMHDSSLRRYLHWVWHSRSYRSAGSIQPTDRPLFGLLMSITLAQIIAGFILVAERASDGRAGTWAFGLALLVAYPMVTAHLLPVIVFTGRTLGFLLRPKKVGKALLGIILESQVKKLRHRHHFTVVAVAGSIGKTGTKLAIAQLLGQHLRVRYQPNNYNDRLTVPLIFFGQQQPALWNIFAWARIIGANAAAVHHPYPYDVVVVELGTDGPGQMQQFAYTKPDLTVLTAITPEHMANLKTLDGVAAEELTVFEYSKRVLLNADNIPGRYLGGKEFSEYSITTNVAHNYFAASARQSLGGQELHADVPLGKINGYVRLIGAQGMLCALAAVAAADLLGLSRVAIKDALSNLAPFAGRMQVLDGVKHSKLIDDTYNATPVAVKAALDVLYGSRAKQRIAVLGSMNELGDYTPEAHQEVGEYCDPTKLDMVLTLGQDAERWIAPAARSQGCVVHSFTSQHAAASYVRKHMKDGALILVKGSQNGVYGEEVVKLLLAHPADRVKLVRQSKSWLRLKQMQISDVTL